MMKRAYVVDGVRTPIGRYAGALSAVRPDDLAAHVLRGLCARHTTVDWSALDDVVLGCVNQSGEDNRNVARMALLLAGLPDSVSGSTINRLCGSSMDAVATAARAIKSRIGVQLQTTGLPKYLTVAETLEVITISLGNNSTGRPDFSQKGVAVAPGRTA